MILKPACMAGFLWVSDSGVDIILCSPSAGRLHTDDLNPNPSGTLAEPA